MCSKFCIAPVDLLMLISCMFKLYLFYNNNEISYHVYKYTFYLSCLLALMFASV